MFTKTGCSPILQVRSTVATIRESTLLLVGGIEMMSPQNPTQSTSPTAALAYSRRLFENITDWYKNADIKAQIILTLDGAFLAFLTGSILKAPRDLTPIIEQFNLITWLFLLLMCLTLAGSIISALACLWSRIYSRSDVERLLSEAGVRIDNSTTYAPHRMWFFQLLQALDQEKFGERLLTVDEDFEIRAMASQIHALSINVSKKHTWVNRGFSLAGCSLLLFLGAGISYIVALM